MAPEKPDRDTPVFELDACAALRADLAAREQRGGAPNVRPRGGGAAGGGAGAGAGADATLQAAAWLPLVVGLETAARLPGRARPEHFRRQRPAWEAAAEALGEGRYARIGARLARWRWPDPRVGLVREVLWALEQPERVGLTRLALAGTTALAALTPMVSVAYGYVIVQTARAIRTLGNPIAALERYKLGYAIGRRNGHRLLLDRVNMGVGSTCLQIGNFPAASRAYEQVVDSPDQVLADAALLGLLNAAIAAQDWDRSLELGWRLLHSGVTDVMRRLDALIAIADVCERIGQYNAAMRAATVGASLAVRPEQRMVALGVLLGASMETQDLETGRRCVSELRNSVGLAAGPYEDARTLLDLARWELRYGLRDQARADISAARKLVQDHNYHQLQFEADNLQDELNNAEKLNAQPTDQPLTSYTPFELTPNSQSILYRVEGLDMALLQVS